MTSNSKLPKVGFDKILYVTDLSDSGRTAFPYAASFAHKYDADLTVFHVVESHDFEKYLVGYISEPLWDELKDRSLHEARQLLISRKRDDTAIRTSVDEMCQQCLSDQEHPYVTYDVSVEIGDPVETILEKAHGEDYDLVVMAKHGHGAVKGALMGDTCQRVVRRSQKPVLVVEVPSVE
jgi:nucleotide-binding universal stress UspA family protein